MADGMTMEIEGLDDLFHTLEVFPQSLVRKAFRKALRAGAEIILAQLQAHAPVSDADVSLKSTGLAPGRLKVGLTARLRVDGAKQMGSATIGPDKATKHVARWIEYGWNLTKGKKGSSKRKVIKNIPAHPFIRPVYEAYKEAALAEVNRVLLEEIGKIWANVDGGSDEDGDEEF